MHNPEMVRWLGQRNAVVTVKECSASERVVTFDEAVAKGLTATVTREHEFWTDWEFEDDLLAVEFKLAFCDLL
ncbi:hypothetical protein [Caballeronia zhejiangensis]|uniref:hypothetical protein n=1 Tax=Caballeronia zhejiangensis TaxID=871203 RepID=UPI001F51883A|nr:hypothetical protein [Caballeronia zhejiangensis]MCI1046911.1 hypothetical protein [Caballeronia zhejiangensis]